MLIEFSVTNYRSFRDRITLSMLAANLKAKDEKLDLKNVFHVTDQPLLLSCAVIYGRNASGKSNLVSALEFMRRFVLSSFTGTEETGGINIEPFRLNTVTMSQPSMFEIVFIVEGIRYRYGFEATTEQIVSEWLYAAPKGVEALQFQRDMQKIKPGRSYKEARDRTQFMRPNALFLSVLAQSNAPLAQKIVKWFRRLVTITGVADTGMRIYTMEQMIGGRGADAIVRIVTALDTGVEGVRVVKGEKAEPPTFPAGMPETFKTTLSALMNDPNMEHVAVNTLHTIYDADGHTAGQIEFDIDDQESEGTRKLFALAGPLSRSLTEGRVLIIDEFDARFHPLLTRQILALFNDPSTNPLHAQLVATTHDTGLLDNRLLRRDQIWFVEKDSKGASTLYSLAEFKGVRNDKDYERGYLEGRYGAIPYVNFLAEAVAPYEVNDVLETE